MNRSMRYTFVHDSLECSGVRWSDDEISVRVRRWNVAVRELLRGDKSRSVGIAGWRRRLSHHFRPESLFPFGYVAPVARRIDEWCYGTFFQPRVLGLQIEVIAVRAQKNVDRQRLEDS